MTEGGKVTLQGYRGWEALSQPSLEHTSCGKCHSHISVVQQKMSLVKGIINTVESRNQGTEPMMNISSLGRMRFILSYMAFRLTFTKGKYRLSHSSLRRNGRSIERQRDLPKSAWLVWEERNSKPVFLTLVQHGFPLSRADTHSRTLSHRSTLDVHFFS